MTYSLETFGTTKVMFVMAATPEFGDALQSRFTPLFTGIGPVEGGVALARALATGPKPDLVVSLGSAGSAVLEQTGVYQASSVSYRDMDASPLGFAKGETPMSGLPIVLALPVLMDGVKSARLSTGANIVSGAAYDDIDADMVDMETFALLRACHQFDVPLLALRGISDGKADLCKLSDWTQYLQVIDQKLAEVVDILGARLSDKPLEFSGYDGAPITL